MGRAGVQQRASKGKPVVPPGSVGIQQFSIRDSITRLGVNIYDKDGNVVAANPTPTMGFLGGPNYPADPTDLGPSVPLPGGFLETFQYLKSVGYDGIEFFQFTQNVGSLRDPAAVTPTNPNGQRQPTIAEIRVLLDKAGLKAIGTHTGSLNSMYDATTGGLSANGLTQISNAQILGYSMIGQAGDPTNVDDARGRRQRERDDHDRLDRGGAALERRRRAPRGPGDQVLLPPGAELVPVLRPGGAPGAEGRQPARVVHREHRPRPRCSSSPTSSTRTRAPTASRSRTARASTRSSGCSRTTSGSSPTTSRTATGTSAWAGPPAGGPYIQNKPRGGNDDDRRDRVGRGRDRPRPSGRREVAGVGRLRQVGPEAGRPLRAPAHHRERRRRRRGRRSGAVAAARLDQRRHHDRAEAVGLQSQNERGRHGRGAPAR